jgi:hypothetical protein
MVSSQVKAHSLLARGITSLELGLRPIQLSTLRLHPNINDVGADYNVIALLDNALSVRPSEAVDSFIRFME